MMITRLGRYVRGSYPPAFYLPYALTWALGVTAVFALGDPRIAGWRLDAGALSAALTFAVVLLLVRAMDDIRDLDYDREHNPDRPLPSGAVRVGDLAVLMAICAAAGLLLNAGRGAVAVALAVGIGYTVLILLVDQKLRWPPGDNLLLSGLVSFPVQILLNLYLYAGVLHQSGLGPSWHAVLPMLVALTAYLHVEYARKVTRTPRPGERSYVTRLGASRTAVVGLVGAAASVVLALVLTRPWGLGPDAQPWGWLMLVPLAFPAYGAYRFWRMRATRWPLLAAGLFLLTSFLAYLAVGLLGKGAA